MKPQKGNPILSAGCSCRRVSPKTRKKKSYTETQEESTYNSQTPLKYPIQSILSPMNQLLLYLNGQKVKVLSNHIFALFLLITENPHGQVFTRFLGLHFPESGTNCSSYISLFHILPVARPLLLGMARALMGRTHVIPSDCYHLLKNRWEREGRAIQQDSHGRFIGKEEKKGAWKR